jgi:hypothetical protein
MSNYCRITGKSRSLPKPNYFPILIPLSPDDVRRFCRITGKSYGLPSHHFIPVILTSFSTKKKCRVTNMAPYLGRHHYFPEISYGKRKHIVLLDYRYVRPKISATADKELLDIINEKETESDKSFVYRVDEKQCNLVFPAKLEVAIRDGDISNIMFAKDSDEILLKLKKGKSVSVGLEMYADNLDDLFEGEGPREEVILERERELEQQKKKRKVSQKGMMNRSITKIFEDKENMKDEKEAIELKRKTTKKKKKVEESPKKVGNHLEKVPEEGLKAFHGKVIVKTRVKNFEKKIVYDNAAGFEISQLSGSYKKPNLKPLVQNLTQIQSKSPEALKKLENAVERLQNSAYEISSLLPTEDELLDVLQNITKGRKSELNGVPGCQIDIDGRRVFLPGEYISNDNGAETFVPGQAMTGSNGTTTFVPGFATLDPISEENNGVNFIAGQIMTSGTDNELNFQAGQFVDNEFVFGQTIYIGDAPKFVEGQTINTDEGIRFVPG